MGNKKVQDKGGVGNNFGTGIAYVLNQSRYLCPEYTLRLVLKKSQISNLRSQI